MQIQISWLLQKPTDLDLHCLQRQGISGFSRTRVKLIGNPVFKAHCVDPDQMPHSAESDLGLHCLPMHLLWDAKQESGKNLMFLKLFQPCYEDNSSTIQKVKFSWRKRTKRIHQNTLSNRK